MTKTRKNTLMQSVAYGPRTDFMALRLKASFHASPAAIMALLAKHRLHQSKNLALRAKKPILFNDNQNDNDNLFRVQEFKSSMVQELFFSEAVFLLSRSWNHVSGCEKWCGLGVEACLYRQGHNTLHESSKSFKAEERVFPVFVKKKDKMRDKKKTYI